ncbi:MAG: GNAT family N-acetyltransferase [Dongiaceae bacterium]
MIADTLIRKARPADARGIARVHVESWRTTYAGIIPDRVMIGMSVDDKAAGWRKLLTRRAPREAVLVASRPDAGIVGFASLGPAQALTHRFAAELYMIYVLTDWQDRGIGRGLLQGAFAHLAGQGLGSAFAWVLADNPARFFYEAVGATRAGERDETLWGVSLHELAYGWSDLSAWLAAQAPGR